MNKQIKANRETVKIGADIAKELELALPKDRFTKFKRYSQIRLFMDVAFIAYFIKFAFFDFTQFNLVIVLWLLLTKHIVNINIEKVIKEEVAKDIKNAFEAISKKGGKLI